MDDAVFYDAIFKRKSVRRYDQASIDSSRLREISKKLQCIKPLPIGVKTEFKIISSDEVTRKLRINAPHYIAAFSENKDAYKVNVGFMLQQMDLYFSANGLGSCWLATPQPTKEVIESSNLQFVILMSFGNPNETLHRSSISEFKRKSLPEITNIENADELLEPVRLAPSGVNLQNWYFTGDKKAIHSYSSKPGFLRTIVGSSYYPVNIGIALCHLQLSAEHLGLEAKFSFDKSRDPNPPKNLEYTATLETEKKT